MKPLPITVSELIDDLNKLFPEKSPALGDTMDYIMFKAGQRSVVNHLLTRQELDNAFNTYTED